MKKIFVLLFTVLSFSGFNCESQDLLLQQSVQNDFPTRDVVTTADNEELFACIGCDSNGDGRGTSVPTISSGILYHWNGSTYDEITNTSIANNGTYGSVYQYFAEAYNATTGKKVLVVNNGQGGSTFFDDGGEHWQGDGDPDDLYAAAVIETRAALSAKGLTRPRAIFVNLGINDAVNGTTDESELSGAVTLFFDHITADFPTTPVLVLIPGRTGSAAMSDRLYFTRKVIINACENYANVYAVGTAAQFIEPGYVNGGGDEIHYSNAGLDWWGDMLNHWFINESYTNEWSRAVISAHFDDLNTTRKNLINTVISGLYDRGDYFQLEHLSNFKTTVVQNMGMDWTFLGYAFRTGASFTANTSISTNGTSTYASVTFFSNWNNRAASQTDFIFGVKVKTRTTAAGTTAIAFGGTNGTAAINFGQGTTNTTWRSNDNTTTSGGEASITADNLYSVARNGTTKELYKGSTLQASTTQASTGTMDVFPRIGCNNNSGVAATFINATFTYSFAARNTTFDLAAFHTDMEALETGW